MKGQKSKSGFTLVEVSVSLVIFSIIAAFCCGILIMASGLFARNHEKTQAVRAANDICSFVSGKLMTAVSIDIKSSSHISEGEHKGEYYERLVFEEGGEIILIERENGGIQPVFDNEYFGGAVSEIKISRDKQVPACVIVTVGIYSGGYEELIYSCTRAVRLLNFTEERADDFSTEAQAGQSGSDALVITLGYGE